MTRTKKQPTSAKASQKLGMYNLHQIQTACGTTLARYVKSKTTGGAAGQKGTRYEDRFALMKIGEAAKSAFSRTGSFSETHNVTFQSQAVCFVDDLLIFHSRTRTAKHFQVKNAAAVTWGQGARSIASDFRNQLKLGRKLGFTTNLSLVVRNKRLAQNLKDKLPRGLKRQVSVDYFPADKRLLALLKFQPMRSSLNELLGPHPSDDHLVSIGRLLLGVWTEIEGPITVKKLIQELLKSDAPLIRPLKPVTKLDSELIAVLNAVPGFEYSVEKGFLIWRYGDSDRGCYQQHCGSDRFSAFTQRIIVRRPSTFEELEGELG